MSNQDTLYTQRIEIRHRCGHVTVAPVYLSSAKSLVKREQENESLLTEIIAGIGPHLDQDTEVYLIIKSKANDTHV